MFEVAFRHAVTRWSLAVMGSYDGVVWTVADPDTVPGGEAAAEFRPVGTRLPAPAVQPTSDPDGDGHGRHRRPPRAVAAGAGRGPRARASTTLAGATPARRPREHRDRHAGDRRRSRARHDLHGHRPRSARPERRGAARTHPIVETGSDFDLEVLPPQINNLAADITEGIDFGWGQVAAVRDRFTSTGFYDKSTNTPPGHSYFRLAQFLADPDEIDRLRGAVRRRRRGGHADRRPPDPCGGGLRDPGRPLHGRRRRGADRAMRRRGSRSASRASAGCRSASPRRAAASPTPRRPSRPRSRSPRRTRRRRLRCRPTSTSSTRTASSRSRSRRKRKTMRRRTSSMGAGIGLLGWIGDRSGRPRRPVRRVLRDRRRVEAPPDATPAGSAPNPSLRIAGAWSEVADRYDEAGVPIARRGRRRSRRRGRYIATEPSAHAAAPRLLALVGTVDRAAYHADEPGDAESDDGVAVSRRRGAAPCSMTGPCRNGPRCGSTRDRCSAATRGAGPRRATAAGARGGATTAMTTPPTTSTAGRSTTAISTPGRGRVTDHDGQDPPIDDDAIDPAELTLEADPVGSTRSAPTPARRSADPELTVDASPELVDVIRHEIARRDATAGERQRRRTHPAAAPRPSPTPAAAPSQSAPPVPPTMPGSPPPVPSANVAPGGAGRLAAPAAAGRPGAGDRHDADRAHRPSPSHEGQHQDRPGGDRRDRDRRRRLAARGRRDRRRAAIDRHVDHGRRGTRRRPPVSDPGEHAAVNTAVRDDDTLPSDLAQTLGAIRAVVGDRVTRRCRAGRRPARPAGSGRTTRTRGASARARCSSSPTAWVGGPAARSRRRPPWRRCSTRSRGDDRRPAARRSIGGR